MPSENLLKTVTTKKKRFNPLSMLAPRTKKGKFTAPYAILNKLVKVIPQEAL